jgi:hypothetical protein
VLKSILGKKVNNARDCIEGCRDIPCFTGCVNTHWPGATFEQVHDRSDASYQETTSTTNAIPLATNNKESMSITQLNTNAISNTGFFTVPLSDIPSLLDVPSISFTTGKSASFNFKKIIKQFSSPYNRH